MEIELFQAAMTALQIVLKARVLGVFIGDSRGLGIIPRPKLEVELLRALESADFRSLRRQAEEWEG